MEKGTLAINCLLFAIFAMVIAFSTPYWVESFSKADNKFVKCGLWEFCFNDYTFWKDYNGKRWLGCWYIFSSKIRLLWEWLSPRMYLDAKIQFRLEGVFFFLSFFICIKLSHPYRWELFYVNKTGSWVMFSLCAFIMHYLHDIYDPFKIILCRNNSRQWRYSFCCSNEYK